MSDKKKKLRSFWDIPTHWSLTIGIHSLEWIIVCWYRWAFSEDDGLMVATCYEWCLRRFWKIDKTP